MEGKINKRGCLEIKRRENFIDQLCPFSNDPQEIFACGDKCPLFGEPLPYGFDNKIVLCICGGKELTFEKFKDERSKR